MSISQASLTLDEAPYRQRSEFRSGVAASTPVLLGIVPYALVLGAQAAQKGLS
ncbi:MAG: branched-chain amino acid ABC transporter permease, partial [Mesorhizobium sp.]